MLSEMNTALGEQQTSSGLAVYLILHQADERGDDDTGFTHDKRRNLIAQALAPSCGLHGEHQADQGTDATIVWCEHACYH